MPVENSFAYVGTVFLYIHNFQRKLMLSHENFPITVQLRGFFGIWRTTHKKGLVNIGLHGPDQTISKYDYVVLCGSSQDKKSFGVEFDTAIHGNETSWEGLAVTDAKGLVKVSTTSREHRFESLVLYGTLGTCSTT
ncbi:hypothetical protein OESDEN_09543 [Oesophagostomum dentatum]|uniref:Uncharacterized protein n=1 Tax=Oesophagostomum dentatum TaxID=61180 RepID=A0A0B1T4B5_OESDE|nr:hypothetical protein OESDEN_09543 [Oesophagostomum dentatum]